jgi:uncharacterized membrane protein
MPVGAIVGKIRKSFSNFVWNLQVRRRVAIGASLGVGVAVLASQLLSWTWQISFLSGYIAGLGTYLVLLVIVILSADGPMTQQRVSKDGPKRMALMALIILVSIFGVGTVVQVLTAVGKHPLGHSRLLLVLSVVAVLLAWFHLHTAFAVHYARLYYEAKDIHGRPFKAGRRSGFRFPGTEIPTYLDFLYVSLSVALTYDPHDVDVENPVMRRNVIVHSLVSFFFNAVVLLGALNAIVTS